MAKTFQGIFTAIITPFERDLQVDYTYLQKLVKFQEANRISGLLVCGTTGENPSVTIEEEQRIIEAAVKARKDIKIIAGIGRSSVSEASHLINGIRKKVDGLVVLPPYYFKPVTDEGLANYFKRVAEYAQPLPIILYNIPRYTGISLTPNLLNHLDIDNIIGVKDSSGDINTTKAFLKEVPHVKTYMGSDGLLLEGLKLGVEGQFSAISNAYPLFTVQAYEAYLRSDLNTAKEFQEKTSAVRAILKEYSTQAALKMALEMKGFPKSYVRPPLIDLTEQQRRELKAKLEAF